MSKLEETLEATARMLYVDINSDSWKTIWRFYGKFHRDFDKPALIWANGSKHWYQHNKRHRNHDKPAVVYANGNKHWFQHGKLHRDHDNPAVVYGNGTKYWYQHGKKIK